MSQLQEHLSTTNFLARLMSEINNRKPSAENRSPAQLPLGTGSALRGISENFSFHSSPESFIASRVAAYQQSHDRDILNKRTPVRAKILNRNVAILSSYKHIKEVLEHREVADDGEIQEPAFIAADAYGQLMDQFFPPPNLLLADGEEHSEKRNLWTKRFEGIENCPVFVQSSKRSDSQWTKQVSDILAHTFGTATNRPADGGVPYDTAVDLYETMKVLSWRILLGIFLGLSDIFEASPEEKEFFSRIQSLHEDLLRGQFSLMPVNVNVGFWKSPRSTGIKSRKLLQKLISERLQRPQSESSGSTFRNVIANLQDDIPLEEIRDHVLMMTSSLAVKSLASLMTAFLLNIFLFRGNELVPADELRLMIAEGQHDNYLAYLKSIYLETERLSPPIVGVMRRSTRDVVLRGDEEDVDTILPAGWDIWSYFVGAGRDAAVFGADCNSFKPARYINHDIPEPMGFGAGSKSCLGKDFIRQIAIHVAEHFLLNAVALNGVISAPGLKAWLGWGEASPEEWAAEIKQLPTQRPKTPVMIEFVKHI